MLSRSFLISQLFGLLGVVCLGLGVAGLSGSGAALHPALASRDLALALTGTGTVLLMLELRILIPVLLRRARRSGEPDVR